MTPHVGATVWNSNDTTVTRRVTDDNPGDAIRLDPGEFIVESYLGYKTIGRLTGRTRKFFRPAVACPTIERFDIDTVVIDGAIWGVAGDRLAGTYAVRPETVR